MLETYQNVIMEPKSTGSCTESTDYTIFTNQKQLYKYFNKVKTPEKLARVYIKNGNCNIASLNNKQSKNR